MTVRLAAYFKALVLLFVAFIILSHYFAVKFFYFKGKQFRALQRLYQDHANAFSYQKQERGFQDSQSIFMTAVATGWITASTVWSNNLTSHTYFLTISSLTCTLAHCLCFSCLYIFRLLINFQSRVHFRSLTASGCKMTWTSWRKGPFSV